MNDIHRTLRNWRITRGILVGGLLLGLMIVARANQAYAWGTTSTQTFGTAGNYTYTAWNYAGWDNGAANLCPHIYGYIWPPLTSPAAVGTITLRPIAAGNADQMGSLLLNVDGRVLAAGYTDAMSALGNAYLGGTPAGKGKFIPGLAPQVGVIQITNAYKNSRGPAIHGVALQADGRVYEWGGLSGVPPTLVKTTGSTPLDGVKSVATTDGATYFIRGNGSIWYRGSGPDVQTASTTPVPLIMPFSGFKQIDGGLYHVVALQSNGKVVSWGYNNEGQTGLLPLSQYEAPHVVSLPGAVKAIACSHMSSFALLADGTVMTWGRDLNGSGLGSLLPLPTKVLVAPGQALKNIVSVWGSREQAYALRADGKLFGMAATSSHPDHYLLGTGPGLPGCAREVALTTATPCVGIVAGAGANPVVAIQGRGVVNVAGTIGGFNTSNAVKGLTSVTAGIRSFRQGSAFGVGIDVNGLLWEWGPSGVLGTWSVAVLPPGAIPIDVSVGAGRYLVLVADGRVFIKGFDHEGLAGPMGQTYGVLTPVLMSGLPANERVIKVETATEDTFLLMASGSVYHKGKNTANISGTGVSGPIASPAWATVRQGTIPIHDIVDLSASDKFCIALNGTGEVYGWGDTNSGVLGLATQLLTGRQLPVQEPSGKFRYMKQVSAGADHAMALSDNGEVYTWGANKQGQLAHGDLSNPRPIPRKINSVRAFKEIAGGGGISLMVSGTGWLWGAGSNAGGNLATTGSPKPSPVVLGQGFQSLGMEPNSKLAAAIKP